MDFKSAKELVIRRIYEAIYTSDDAEYFFASEIRQMCDDTFSTIFVRKVIADLIKEQTIEGVFFEDDAESGYTITAKGIAAAERIVAKSEADGAMVAAVPASDRIVTVHHNEPEAQQLFEAVEQGVEAVRSSNTISEDDRSWISVQLDAGLALLKKAKQLSLSAIRSTLLTPFGTALKSVSEENLKKIIQHAVAILRAWLGY